jgi:L-lactate dehydrogenase complex protein LldG
MSARESILNRVRVNSGKSGATTQAELDVASSYIAKQSQGPRPRGDWPDLIARFKEQALRLASTVDEVVTTDAIPLAVRRYLDGLALPLAGVCWPELARLDWRASGIDMQPRPPRDGDALGVTSSFCAIAETGTLLLTTSPAAPNTTSLLPDTHIAIAMASRIVAGMEEACNLLRAELDQLPRACSFISGPSRTGDIEQTIVLGAHGPYRVHIILVSERAGAASELLKTDWWRRKPASDAQP